MKLNTVGWLLVLAGAAFAANLGWQSYKNVKAGVPADRVASLVHWQRVLIILGAVAGGVFAFGRK